MGKMDQQYDIDPEMRKLFELKKKQRAEAKEYFQKILYNPHRSVDDGHPFDPAIMRYNSLNTYRSRLYNVTPTFFLKVALGISPVVLIFFSIKYIKKQKEEWFRSGYAKYEDRAYKLHF